MNKISYNVASSTLSTVVMAGLLSSQWLNVLPENLTQPKDVPHLLPASYFAGSSGATFDMFRGSVTGQYDHTPIRFEHAIESFYVQLVANQESLGADFEKLLFDNLWDLYES